MKKSTNPFNTIEGAIATLADLGTNPTFVGATYPLPWGSFHWTEEVLSVDVSRGYPEKGNHFYSVHVHLTEKGFKEFVKCVGEEDARVYLNAAIRSEHTSSTDRLSLRPNHLLEIFTLVEKGRDLIL